MLPVQQDLKDRLGNKGRRDQLEQRGHKVCKGLLEYKDRWVRQDHRDLLENKGLQE